MYGAKNIEAVRGHSLVRETDKVNYARIRRIGFEED